jgi:GT2 family glycosyltransferase
MSSDVPDPAEPVLTLAVLSYNGRHLLEGMLSSLAAQRFRDFRVFVVDNGTTKDDTVQWLSERWPLVQVIALAENVGVTPALNVCADACRSEFVGLFNNDLELHPDCLGEMVEALQQHPDAGSVSPKLIDFHDRRVLDGAGDVFLWAGAGGRRGHGERDTGQYDHARAIFGACGGAALYRRSALDRVGPFDEEFHAFYEDVDWAFRAQLAGFSCRYVPSAVVYHMGSATLGKGMTDFTRYHMWRNGLWIVMKDYPPAALLRHAPQVLRAFAGNLDAARRERRLGVWARAMRDAFLGLPSVLRKRGPVQRVRNRTVRELEAVVAADHAQ